MTQDAVSVREGLERSLERLAQRIRESRSARSGVIAFSFAEPIGGTYHIRLGGAGEVRVAAAQADSEVEVPSLFEVLGDPEVIRSVIDGEEDARRQFQSGGFRIRGDLRHLSDLALELGILKESL